MRSELTTLCCYLFLPSPPLLPLPCLRACPTAPFISFDGEKGVRLEMKQVAAFADVDEDTEPIFDYDVDRVRARPPFFP